jgi:hypothetical protein
VVLMGSSFQACCDIYISKCSDLVKVPIREDFSHHDDYV